MPDDPNENQDDPGRLRQMMEDANARAATAEAELAQTRSREMFRDAGLDPTKPLHAAAMRGYDGDLDPTAVQAYVADLGITEAATPPPPPVPVVGEDEQAANIRIANAAMGGGNPPPAPDRREQLRKDLETASRKGNIAEMDRLSQEFSRAGGFRVKDDIPGMT